MQNLFLELKENHLKNKLIGKTYSKSNERKHQLILQHYLSLDKKGNFEIQNT